MLKNVTVMPDTKLSKILFFDKVDFEQFPERVVPLFGPNGIGKSTFISILESNGFAKRGWNDNKKELAINITRPTYCYSYMNTRDNVKTGSAVYTGKISDVMQFSRSYNSKNLSEGQAIIYSAYDLLRIIDNQPIGDSWDTVLLFDEIDSGLSIDNIDFMMRKMKRVIKRRPDVMIVFSFNSPRVLKWFPNVLSMYDGTRLKLHTEDDMMEVIRAHKKEFDKARKTKGLPKVFYE